MICWYSICVTYDMCKYVEFVFYQDLLLEGHDKNISSYGDYFSFLFLFLNLWLNGLGRVFSIMTRSLL